MSRNFHNDEHDQEPNIPPLDKIYEGRPDVSEMSYEELEREIKYERALEEVENNRSGIDPEKIKALTTATTHAMEIGKQDGREVWDDVSARRGITNEERDLIYARQNAIYEELERRDNLKTPSNELGKEAHQAIGELEERGKDAKTSTQELAKEAREATHEIKEQDKDRGEPER
jgi:hypothetical protein